MNYTDYDMIEKDLEIRCDKFDWECEHAWKLLVTSTWNILRRINCKDAVTYETIINGMANAYNAGAEAEYHDHNTKEYVWSDPWDD